MMSVREFRSRRCHEQRHRDHCGPAGNLWFTAGLAGKIGRITHAGVSTEFSAGIKHGGQPTEFTRGPDGNLVHRGKTRRIGRSTRGGVLTNESPRHHGFRAPYGSTAGSDGNLWFTSKGRGQLARGATPGSPLGESSRVLPGLAHPRPIGSPRAHATYGSVNSVRPQAPAGSGTASITPRPVMSRGGLRPGSGSQQGRTATMGSVHRAAPVTIGKIHPGGRQTRSPQLARCCSPRNHRTGRTATRSPR